jgi:enoyl-CoA hydratase
MAGQSKLGDYRPAPYVRQLVLDDPDTRNALGLELRGALVEALTSAAADSDCRVVIVTGSGKIFASGSDIRILAQSTPADVGRAEIREMWEVLAGFAKPLIAALNGHALGGGLELALCADIVIAARGIKLGNPEPKLGIMPGGGATQRLTRAVGLQRASYLLLTGEAIDADTAERWGLVSEVCEPASLPARVLALAGTIAALPPRALAAIKRVAREGFDLPLDAALALEFEAFLEVFATADKREGLAAFLEKRSPKFTGE